MSDSTVTIRPFTQADQGPVRRLILTGLGEHFGFVDESRNPDLDDVAASYLAPGHAFVVAELAGELVGTRALLEEAPGVGRLVRMSVDPAHRRRGIGRSLVAHLTDLARRRGYRRLVLETNDDWYDAIGLYQACGFVAYDRAAGEVHLALELPADSPPHPASG